MTEPAVIDARVVEPQAVARRPLVPVPDEALISFEGVWRSWNRGKNRRTVLREVNLDIGRGRAINVSGANGAGKTTLLRIGTGILAPDQGRVTIEGATCEQSWREYHRRIGFLSAGDRGLYARVSVRSHLDYWSAVAFVPRRERAQAVDDTLARFGLEDVAKRRADRLSQGQRQRLRLALTVIHRPKVTFLDEPTNSLDQEGVEMLTLAVRDLLLAGGSVIWCSPLGEEQPVAFDETFVLEQGTLHVA